MSVVGSNILAGASGQGGGYTIDRSVRLRSSASAYLSRTPASAGNRKTWTFSFWHKRGAIADCIVFGSRNAGTTTVGYIGFQSDKFDFQFGATGNRIQDAAVRRDPSAWAHFHVVCDTTNATSTERMQLWVNGVRVTSFSQTSYPTQNADSDFNVADFHAIGRYGASASNYVDGYLTEINFVDGQALTPSDFGEYDADTGVWKAKKYVGTYGNNGFYLNFSDNSAATAAAIGKDYSGNGNNWTPNNISVTSGVTYDSMLDVPTPYADGGNGRGNYAVLNPLDKDVDITVSDGNLKATAATGVHNNGRSTMGCGTSGFWYMEFTYTGAIGGSTAIAVGLYDPTFRIDNGTHPVTSGDGFYGLYASSGTNMYTNGTTPSPAVSAGSAGDILQMAYDVAGGNLWFGKNNVWYDSAGGTTGNPSTGANPTITTVATGRIFGYDIVSNTINFNFGQRPFAYTPPTGFKALNTQNLPEPTIVNGGEYFNAVLWNGAYGGTSINVTGFGFQPDLIWTKTRNNAYGHFLQDAVRGIGVGDQNTLSSNTTAAEADTAGYASSFLSDGFNIASTSGGTSLGNTEVTWAWKANGAGVSNTAGTITSTVSANTTSGFSVVTYTGNGTAGATIGHGLGVAPSMMIAKNRSSGGSASYEWTVYHTSLGATKAVFLNDTGAAATDAGYWYNTAPTSTLITVPSNTRTNVNGSNFVIYCFAAIHGYSAFGSYTGNGSADGVFVYLGFRARFLLIKSSSNAQNWHMIDTARDTYNLAGQGLDANTSAAEYTPASSGYPMDILSNGFKIRYNSEPNISGATYIFAAFAENPTKYSLAR